MSLVFQNIDPLPSGECVRPTFVGGGRTHSPGGKGGGGSIFWKTKDMGLPSYSNNLSTGSRLGHSFCLLRNGVSSVFFFILEEIEI
jgi:hypothetical protein